MVQVNRDARKKTTGEVKKEEVVRLGLLGGGAVSPLIEAPFYVQEFNKERGANLRIMRSKVADIILASDDKWEYLVEDLGFTSDLPTSTIIAYERPGVKLGREIVFALDGEPTIRISTGEHIGKKDVALVARDITAENIQREGEDFRFVIPGDKIIVVPDFPEEGEWYFPYAETTVPHGRMLKDEELEDEIFEEARWLGRRDGGNYVGILVRKFADHPDDRKTVYADRKLSSLVGIAVEISEDDLKRNPHLFEVE